MPRIPRTNNVETRLNDAKKQYNINENLIKAYSIKIKKGIELDAVELKDLKDFQKLNITLRKQINEMEILLQNGQIKTDKESNPFE